MGAGQPKQYLALCGVPVIVRTIRAIARLNSLTGILIGLSADDHSWPQIRHELDDLPCPLLPYTGGSERADTVRLGLQEIARQAGENQWVLVHDAVRPLVRVADIEKLVSTVGGHADGGLLALPVADTLKSESDGCAAETVDRSHLWRALTPQYFPVSRLLQALTQCRDQGVLVTDESSAMESIGARPRLVTGHADNIKLTFPSDLDLLESLLQKQGLA